MENMDQWDLVLIVAAGYVAAMALVRLMAWRRDQMLAEFRRQMEDARKRKEAEKKKQQASQRAAA
jgi:hypothetical protein